MDFKTYLTKRTKENLDEESVIKLIKNNCKNIDLNYPLYRGMTFAHPYQLIDTSTSNRRSANTSNYYTVIIDNSLKNTNYPLRSKSMICSTNRSYANLYAEDHIDDNGALYVIIPFDNIILGVCHKRDIWDTNILIGNKYYHLNYVNDLMSYAGVPDDSYSEILNYLVSDNWDRKKHSELAKEFPFGIDKNVADEKLHQLYSIENLNFSFIKNDEISSYKNNEVWFSGKSIAISDRKWKHILSQINNQ